MKQFMLALIWMNSAIPINGRKKIYSLLDSAIRNYIENNESSMICAEGKYYRDEESSAD